MKERWLKAGVEQEDGSITAKTKGNPQKCVVRFLLANVHRAFDRWIDETHAISLFKHYAYNIAIYCSNE